MAVHMFDAPKRAKEEVEKHLDYMIGEGHTIIVAGNVVYAGGEITTLEGLEDVDILDEKWKLENELSIPENSYYTRKYRILSPITNLKMKKFPWYPPCTVPISMDPILFLQVTGKGIIITDGTNFIDAPLEENLSSDFQLWREGEDWILHLPFSSARALDIRPGIYRLRRAKNPFKCQIVSYDTRDSRVITDAPEEYDKILYEGKSVVFEENYSIPEEEFTFEKIYLHGKTYHVPRILLKSALGVGRWVT